MAGQLETNEAASGVDVVVPVYRAAEALGRCLTSVSLHTSLPPHRLIVVVDGPQPRNVEEVLNRRLELDPEGLQILRQSARRGFIAAVNRGMLASNRDVVLLNSDTEVTAEWIEKLRAAAYSAERIATVTPLSNNATICSLPEFLEENLLPAGISTDAMGEIVEAAARREYPRLPTGVGVCLYIRRAALDAVGLFDESRFGLGYGEENEFCTRATAAVFEHVLDDATFIFHAGHRSFGSDAARREKRAVRLLRSIDPSYIPRVAAFIDADPLRLTRQRVVSEIRRRQGRAEEVESSNGISILHVVHGWPPFDVGGTETYAQRLAHSQAGKHRVSVFARIGDPHRLTGSRVAYLDGSIRLRLVVNNFDRRNPIVRNALVSRQFERELHTFVDQVQPDLVHVHHLAGHSASLMTVLSQRRLPIVYQLQDWWAMCGRANLWRADETLCPGPTAGRCSRCLPMTSLPPSFLLNQTLHIFRRLYLKRQIGRANAYISGSHSVLDWYREAGLLSPKAPFHVLDYGVPVLPKAETKPDSTRGAAGPLRFGVIGTMMPHKGAHVAVEAFCGITYDRARLLLWGNSAARPEYVQRLRQSAEPGTVQIEGPFEESHMADVFASIDVLIVPSVGLESFGIVAREAMSAGVPVIASRRGALQELDVDGRCGATFEAENPAALRSWIDRLIETPDILRSWIRALPEPVAVETHADAVEEIYRDVLGRYQ
jgi:glycosyltransferase involved in cell wall biosynthesis/GT2 family glycosyltransferase